MPKVTIFVRVYREPYEVMAPTGRLFLDLLRYDLGLTETKEGYGAGFCRACTVLRNGRMIKLLLGSGAVRRLGEVVGIKGLAQSGLHLSGLRAA